jgi:hypothetical protein
LKKSKKKIFLNWEEFFFLSKIGYHSRFFGRKS